MRTLARFIREHREQILTGWLESVSQLPSAQHVSTPAIRDHIPSFLDMLADAIERNDFTSVPLGGLPNLHAALRLREGYDLRQVIAEYRTLRRVIHAQYSDSEEVAGDMRPKMRSLRVMHGAIDAAIADAVDQYSVDRDRAREMFISMMGHDLRDPLNTVVFSLQMMLDGALGDVPPAARKAAARAATSAKRMEAMIHDLLDFAHGRLGPGLPVVPVRIDALPLIAETVQELAHAHPEREITCLCEPSQGNFAVEWDGDRIAQAISNLVSNAISHGQDPIVVEPVDRGETIIIEVRNRGSIRPELLPRLFDPFTHPGSDRRQQEAEGDGGRVEMFPGANRRRGHLGLGLYIVREIAEAHGGSAEAESANGQAIFRLTLPRVAVA